MVRYAGGDMMSEYSSGGTLLRKYVYSDVIDEPICMIAGGNTYYYHFDGLGSVTMLTDSGGQKVVGYRYDAFGTPTQTNYVASPPVNRFMFTGREYDNDSLAGLYYYRARFYKPSIGRFLQTDPIGYKDGLNLYTYVSNDPINYFDPYGLAATCTSTPIAGWRYWRERPWSEWRPWIGVSIPEIGFPLGFTRMIRYRIRTQFRDQIWHREWEIVCTDECGNTSTTWSTMDLIVATQTRSQVQHQTLRLFGIRIYYRGVIITGGPTPWM